MMTILEQLILIFSTLLTVGFVTIIERYTNVKHWSEFAYKSYILHINIFLLCIYNLIICFCLLFECLDPIMIPLLDNTDHIIMIPLLDGTDHIQSTFYMNSSSESGQDSDTEGGNINSDNSSMNSQDPAGVARGPEGDVSNSHNAPDIFDKPLHPLIEDDYGKDTIDYCKETNEITANKISQLNNDNDPEHRYKFALQQLWDYSISDAVTAKTGNDSVDSLNSAKSDNLKAKALNSSVTPPSNVATRGNVIDTANINTDNVSHDVTRPEDWNM